MKRDAGSVLLEALVATVVVAGVMAVMFTAIGQTDDRRRQIEARRGALMVARSELAAVGADIPLKPGEASGLDGDFAWRVVIEPGQADALDGDVAPPARVVVAVRAASGGPDLATLTTLRVAPAP